MIAAVESRIVTTPLPKGRSLPQVGDEAISEPIEVRRLVVTVRTDDHQGCGWSEVSGSGRAEQTLVEEVFAPIAIGAHPFSIERIYGKARARCPEILLGGIEARAYAALDVAIWDLQAKMAGQPLWRLLGGARDSVPCHVASTAWPGLSADRVVEIAKPILAEGVGGLRVGISSRDPIKDAGKVQHVRDELGEEVWFGVQGNCGLDLSTALAFGRFLEEEMDADMFADPCPANDLDAYARLADSLEVPVAAGSTLGAGAFAELVNRTRVGILQPNPGRVGGLTALLKIIDLAETNHRVVMPVGGGGLAVQLAYGRAGVVRVDYPNSAYDENNAYRLKDGQLLP